MSGFLPQGYEVPAGASGYFSLKEPGQYKVRILSQPVLGYSYWIEEDGKNMKIRVGFDKKSDIPSEIAEDKQMHFWAMKVWNYNLKRVQIWEISQKSIMKALTALTEDKDWGDPFSYDIKITKKGTGKQTEYTITPAPKKQLTDEETLAAGASEVVLENLFTGENPFIKKGE